MKSERQFFSSIMGLRAITHISIIALHTTMVTTAHLPSDGYLWERFKSHLVYSMMQAGGIQVDFMFLFSGFLLTYNLLNAIASNRKYSFRSFMVKRAMRMLPCIFIVALIGYMAGDSWDGNSIHPTWIILSQLLFLTNYLDVDGWGSFTLSLCWSCCVDYHIGIVLFLLIKMIHFIFKQLYPNEDSRHESIFMAKVLRLIFIALIGVTLYMRSIAFTPDTVNIFILGKHSHFGSIMTDHSYNWVQKYYGHTWKTNNDYSYLSLEYMNKMYLKTHTRCGPIFVGALLACQVYLIYQHLSSTTKSLSSSSTFSKDIHTLYTILSQSICWISTLLSLVILLIPCLPPAKDAPLEAQYFATVALRTMAASAGALLLFRTLVPKAHIWYWPLLSDFLSLPIFIPIAKLSFASYLIHFRILLELNFRPYTHQFITYIASFVYAYFHSSATILNSALSMSVVPISNVTSVQIHHSIHMNSSSEQECTVISNMNSSTCTLDLREDPYFWLYGYMPVLFVFGTILSFLLSNILYYGVEMPIEKWNIPYLK